MQTAKFKRILSIIFSPLYEKIIFKIHEKRLPALDDDFKDLKLSGHALQKLIIDYDFNSVLDVGSGSGDHARIFNKNLKKVTALDLGKSIYAKNQGSNYLGIENIEGDFYNYNFDQKYDCLWASHVLEHQANPGLFIKKCIELVKCDGILAITVPPMEENVLGGHLGNWNAGILLYNLVINGLDCSDASILSYGYNISVIVRNRKRKFVDLSYDNGDIKKLIKFFPNCINQEPFDGRIKKWNW